MYQCRATRRGDATLPGRELEQPGAGGAAPTAGAEAAPVATMPSSRAEVHAAWAQMLSGYFPDGSDSAYVTLTWSDDYARRHHVHGPKSALRDVRAYLQDIGVRQFYLAVEQTDRANVPHVHGIIRIGGMSTRKWLWGQWFATRKSMARILPVQDGCLSYVTKYVLKDNTATSLDWQL